LEFINLLLSELRQTDFSGLIYEVEFAHIAAHYSRVVSWKVLQETNAKNYAHDTPEQMSPNINQLIIKSKQTPKYTFARTVIDPVPSMNMGLLFCVFFFKLFNVADIWLSIHFFDLIISQNLVISKIHIIITLVITLILQITMISPAMFMIFPVFVFFLNLLFSFLINIRPLPKIDQLSIPKSSLLFLLYLEL